MRSIKQAIRSLSILLTLALSVPADASHLIGGNLGYVYMGETAPGSQIYRYQVYMQFYLNCGTESNWETLAGLLNTNNGVLPVGVYTQDPQDPNANKQRFAIVPLALVDSSLITPDLPGGCTVGEGLCTKLGVLMGVVDLPLNFGGYHLYFQMNARNDDIVNLTNPGMTGIGYYAFIPPPLLVNSSPIWLGDPTPLLCIGDTSTFINSATDPDGDQLIFSFERPYSSVTGGGGIIQPPNVLPNTIPLVNYVAGSSVAQPFGVGGYAFINGATGLTRYVPPAQGNYVVAVEVKEYRNGVLIGRTRRDLQLQAVICPPNDAPQPLGAQPVSYTVQAGEQLCFDMSYLDPNADSLFLEASGTIFNGALFNPPATIIAPINGSGNVTSTFCWNTTCAQAGSQPYLFSVSVSDNGCPPRTLDVVFQVTVLGFTGPTAITGPAQVCTGQTSSAYSTGSISGATYNWVVSGGTIASGQGSNSIIVNWGVAGPGTVSVSATNSLGCESVPVSIPVTVVPLPAANAGSDASICIGADHVIGGAPTGPAGSSYSWTPSLGLSGTAIANPVATPMVTTEYIVQVTNSGCARRDTVRITVNDPQVDAGADASLCAGGDVQLNATGVGSFSWSPAAGLSATDIADPIADPTSTTLYHVLLTDAIGCTAMDSVLVTVNVLPVVSAGPDLTPCAGTSVALGGSPTGPAGSVFNWSPTTGLNDTGIANPVLSVTGDEEYVVTVTDANQCANSDTVSVTVLPLPDVDAGPDFSVCAGESVQLQGSGTGDLLWTPAFGLSDPTIPDPICQPEITTTYVLTVTGSNTCTNSDQATVTVNVLPNANAGIDRTICAGDSIQIGTPSPGTFSWDPAIGLSDATSATPIASPAVTTTYIVTLTDPTTCTAVDSVLVTVVPVSAAGSDGSLSLCSSGTTTDLFAQLGGTPDPGGQWLGPDQAPHGGSVDPSVDPQGSYTYIVGAGTICADSAEVQVTINTPNVQFTGNNTICAGGSTQVTASGGDQYAWSPATGVSDPSIADPTLDPTTTTTYTVSVTDAGGCVSEGQLTITVNDLPLVDAGSDVAICDGASTAIGGSPTSPSGTSYLWSPSAGLSDPAVANPTAQPGGTTTYVVLVTDAQQCSAIDSLMVTVNALPAMDAGSDVAICIGASVQLNASGSGSFSWTPSIGLNIPNVSDPLASPSTTTTYTVTLTDNNSCSSTDELTVTVNMLPVVSAGSDNWLCQGSSTVLNATGPGTFVWSPAGSLDDATSASPTATPNSTTTYTVTITDSNNCSSVDAVLITVGVDPPISAGNGSTVCAGTPVTLGGAPTSVPGSSYLWTPATDLDDPTSPNPVATPSTTTEYTLVVSNDTCTSSAAVTITIGSLGQAAFTSRFEAGCDVLRAFFTDASTGAVSWNWDLGHGNSSTEMDPQTTLPYGQTSIVTLTITDASGCTESVSQVFNTETYNELVNVSIPNIFTPNGDGKNDVFTLDTEAMLGPCTTMQVMNRWGQKVFENVGNNNRWDGRTFSGEPASAGTYFYVIEVKDLRFEGNVMLVR